MVINVYIERRGAVGKCTDQISRIHVTLFLQLLLIPGVNTLNGLFEGVNIHVLIRSDSHTVGTAPALHDLFITGPVDVTLISNCLLTSFVNDLLLLWS